MRIIDNKNFQETPGNINTDLLLDLIAKYSQLTNIGRYRVIGYIEAEITRQQDQAGETEAQKRRAALYAIPGNP